MNKQQYIENLLADAKDWIDENAEYYDRFDDAYDEMQMVITGNDNGSYYCSTRRAEESLSGVMWDNDVIELCKDLGYDGIPTEKGAEACDVIVRYVLCGDIYGEAEDYFDEVKNGENE